MPFDSKCNGSLYEKTQDNTKIKDEENFNSTIQESLDKIIANEEYETYNIIINNLNTKGGNYLGDLYEVDVKGQTGNDPKETSIFIKRMPKELPFKSMVSISQCYDNELFFYEEIAKVVEELFVEADIPVNERFKIVKYYPESTRYAMFFENLNRRGYTTLHRNHVLPLNFAESAIKELAKFHSLTFILKEKRNDLYEKVVKTIKSPIFFERNNEEIYDQWKEFLTSGINICLDNLDEKFKNKVEEIKCLREQLIRTVTIDSTPRLSSVNCLCHGDIKSGNILFRENDAGRSETVFIDYQYLNYGSPINDIYYLIYLGSDRKFRKDHLENLKNLYHDTMTKFLKYFDLDINSFYPKHVFESDFRETLYYGLLVSPFLLPFLLNEEPLTNGVAEQSTLHTSFRERINGIIEDYIELGIL